MREEAGERRRDARDRLAVDPLARLVGLVRLTRAVVDGGDAVGLQRGDVRPGLLGQYARRQETWARRIPGAIELPGGDGPERNADRLLELIR